MLPLLRELTDQYGVNRKAAAKRRAAASAYIAELHAELVRGLARHVDAAAEPRLTAAPGTTPPAVLIEALHAWAASRGPLPPQAADLRTHGDWRVRVAALETLVARRHGQVRQFLAAALRDTEVRVRFAAMAGLGVLGDPESQAQLKELMKDRIDGVRAEAARALARAGAKKAVLEAAGDGSWRVRIEVAHALGAYWDRDAAAVAAKLLDDPSVEVQHATVAALARWPLERAGSLLLTAMGKTAFIIRKSAPKSWPRGGRRRSNSPSKAPFPAASNSSTSSRRAFESSSAPWIRRPSARHLPLRARGSRSCPNRSIASRNCSGGRTCGG